MKIISNQYVSVYIFAHNNNCRIRSIFILGQEITNDVFQINTLRLKMQHNYDTIHCDIISLIRFKTRIVRGCHYLVKQRKARQQQRSMNQLRRFLLNVDNNPVPLPVPVRRCLVRPTSVLSVWLYLIVDESRLSKHQVNVYASSMCSELKKCDSLSSGFFILSQE